MRRIQWDSIDSHNCVLQIEDGQNAVTDMVGGAHPFVTEMDDDDDLFALIRPQSGNIQVVIDSVNDLADLVGSVPMSRKVTLTVDNAVAWQGFLNCETFSQSWDAGPINVSLPVCSALDMLTGINFHEEGMGYRSLAAWLLEMNRMVGNIWTGFIFPLYGEPETVLSSLMCDKVWEGGSWLDFLEDLCGLMGWMCMEWGDRLVFVSADKVAPTIIDSSLYAYQLYTVADMQAKARGESAPGTPMAFDHVSVQIDSADHRLDYLPPRGKITVTGELVKQDENVWSMDFINRNEVEITNKRSYLLTFYMSHAYKNNTEMRIINNNGNRGNIKFLNGATGSDDSLQGGSLVEEWHAEVNGMREVTAGDSDWTQRLIVRAKSNSVDMICANIVTDFYWTPSAAFTGYWDLLFMLDCEVEYATSANGYFSPYNGYIYIAFRIGDFYYHWYNSTTQPSEWATGRYIMKLHVVNGKIVTNDGSIPPYFAEKSFLIDAPDSGGRLTMEIFAPVPSSSDSYGTNYIAFKNISVRLKRTNRTGIKKDKNVGERVNVGEYSHNWSNTSRLTIYQDGRELAWSYVMDSLGDYAQPLYGDDYPENMLADRVATYYSQARRMISADVKGNGGMLDPSKMYTLAGDNYVCLWQKVDWREDRVTGGFFEYVID